MHGKHLIYYSKPQCGRAGFLPKSNRCALYYICCCLVGKSCPTVCDPCELQHDRLPCPSPSPWVCSSLCPLCRWCHPIISSSVIPFSSCLQSFPASGIFANESVLRIRWPKYWSFSFSISPSNEYSGLIFFRIDWFALLAVPGTPKSLH